MESPQRLYTYIAVGAASFGALVGSWAALSSSEIVKTVLPLLFAVISGAGVFKLTRIDPFDGKSYYSMMLFAVAATAFSLSCIVATLTVLYSRPIILARLNNYAKHVDIGRLPSGSSLSNKPFEAVMLRNWLEAIGTESSEIEKILATAPAPTAMTKDEVNNNTYKTGTYEYMTASIKTYYERVATRNNKITSALTNSTAEFEYGYDK